MKKAKMDAASKFRSIQAEARVLKLYRPKIVKAIQESIHNKFESKWASGKGDPVGFVESLDDWIFLDLNWVVEATLEANKAGTLEERTVKTVVIQHWKRDKGRRTRMRGTRVDGILFAVWRVASRACCTNESRFDRVLYIRVMPGPPVHITSSSLSSQSSLSRPSWRIVGIPMTGIYHVGPFSRGPGRALTHRSAVEERSSACPTDPAS